MENDLFDNDLIFFITIFFITIIILSLKIILGIAISKIKFVNKSNKKDLNENFNNIRYKSATEYKRDDVNKSLIDFCKKRGYVNDIKPVDYKREIDIAVERLSIDTNKKNLLNNLKSDEVIKEKISSITVPKEDVIKISPDSEFLEFLGYVENSKKRTTNYDFQNNYSWW